MWSLVRRWYSVYDPWVAVPSIGMFAYLSWVGPHRWAGLALVFALFGVLAPLAFHMEHRLARDLDRESREEER